MITQEDTSMYSQPFATSSFVQGIFTVATLYALLPPANYLRMYAWVQDLFGGNGDFCVSDGQYWKPVRPLLVQNLAASDITLQALTHAPTQIMTGALALGVTKTVTLGTTNAYPGAKFRVLRQATGLGALLGGLGVSLPVNGWADYEFDGAVWQKTAAGMV